MLRFHQISWTQCISSNSKSFKFSPPESMPMNFILSQQRCSHCSLLLCGPKPGPCSECSDCILISQGSHKAGYCDCSQQLFVFVSDINCFMANFLHRIVNPGREQSTSQHITSKPLHISSSASPGFIWKRYHLHSPSPCSCWKYGAAACWRCCIIERERRGVLSIASDCDPAFIAITR